MSAGGRQIKSNGSTFNLENFQQGKHISQGAAKKKRGTGGAGVSAFQAASQYNNGGGKKGPNIAQKVGVAARVNGGEYKNNRQQEPIQEQEKEAGGRGGGGGGVVQEGNLGRGKLTASQIRLAKKRGLQVEPPALSQNNQTLLNKYASDLNAFTKGHQDYENEYTRLSTVFDQILDEESNLTGYNEETETVKIPNTFNGLNNTTVINEITEKYNAVKEIYEKYLKTYSAPMDKLLADVQTLFGLIKTADNQLDAAIKAKKNANETNTDLYQQLIVISKEFDNDLLPRITTLSRRVPSSMKENNALMLSIITQYKVQLKMNVLQYFARLIQNEIGQISTAKDKNYEASNIAQWKLDSEKLLKYRAYIPQLENIAKENFLQNKITISENNQKAINEIIPVLSQSLNTSSSALTLYKNKINAEIAQKIAARNKIIANGKTELAATIAKVKTNIGSSITKITTAFKNNSGLLATIKSTPGFNTFIESLTTQEGNLKANVNGSLMTELDRILKCIEKALPDGARGGAGGAGGSGNERGGMQPPRRRLNQHEATYGKQRQ